MRASLTEQTASTGVSEVMAAFSRLGWGPVETHRHDLGTDLFVQVRDRRRYDLGLLMGVQVKSGPSYFSRPERAAADEQRDGWWYAENDKRHFDYWVSHRVPHLLVLHDEDDDVAYWVHVTSDAVVDTGLGAKILVPRRATLDDRHFDDLLAVAATARPALALEGTAWTGAEPPTSKDVLRFAMVVPRLIAPHPNADRAEPLTPAQAVALMMQARFLDLRRNAERFTGVTPTLVQARTHAEWPWRFAGALAKRMLDDDDGLLRAALESAPDSPSRAAAAVALASFAIEYGRPQEALATLDVALAEDDMHPLDDVWLKTERARASLEARNVEEARVQASELLAASAGAPDDVTATALRGVAAILLFDTAPWAERDIGAAIQATDTAAAWWRTQTASRGVMAVVEREFKSWARDTAVTLGGQDEANNLLYVAALTASHLGDHPAWRHLSALLGRDTLLRLDRHAAARDAAAGLRTLRLAGAADSVKLAVRRLADDGPALAVREAGADIDLERSTRTSIFADLALLERGGDLLDETTAIPAFHWLTGLLDDAGALLRLAGHRGFDPDVAALDALVGLVATVPDLAVDLAVSRVPVLGTDEPSPLAVQTWAKLLHAIPGDAWTHATATALLPAAADPNLRWAVLRIAAAHDAGARDELLADARNGSLDALGALGRVDWLDTELVHAVVPGLIAGLASFREEVRGGTLSFGPGDPAQPLAVIVGSHPHADGLEALLAFLEDDDVPRGSKRQALVVIAHDPARLGDDAHDRLCEIAERAPEQTSPMDDPLLEPDIRGEAAYLTATLAPDKDEAVAMLSRLFAGPPRHRRWAVRLASRTEALAPALTVLLHDQDPGVRATAAAETAAQVAQGRGGRALEAALEQAAGDPGRQVALAIADALANTEHLLAEAAAVVDQLRDHPSATVRSCAGTCAV